MIPFSEITDPKEIMERDKDELIISCVIEGNMSFVLNKDTPYETRKEYVKQRVFLFLLNNNYLIPGRPYVEHFNKGRGDCSYQATINYTKMLKEIPYIYDYLKIIIGKDYERELNELLGYSKT